MLKNYSGPLTSGKMPYEIERIYWIWMAQVGRCYRKTHVRFKTYGARGIRVRYSSRDFINWYLKNCPGPGMHVGRKDHKKSYTFENLEFQTARENTLEVLQRCGNPTQKITKEIADKVREELQGKPHGFAAKLALKYGVSDATISYIKSGKIWR